MMYVIACKRVANTFAHHVGAVIYPAIVDIAREPADERTDAKPHAKTWEEEAAIEGQSPKQARALLKAMRQARKSADVSFNQPAFEAAAFTAGERTLKHSKHEFKRLGIDIRSEPTMTPLIDGWRHDNVALITKMQTDSLDRIETVLRDGWGQRAETLSGAIKDILGSSDDPKSEGKLQRRADLIARDQVLTLHSKITRHRQKKAGINKYIWTTSNDERVRPEHEELEGETFSWDGEGDPEEGHPGEAVNCRCVAYPVLDDEFLDES